MAYYLKKPSQIDPDIVVYYCGNRRWSDDFSSKSLFQTQEEINDMIENTDGTNGGWSTCSIVSE